MSETPEQRALSVEAVRFARREACADVVADLEAENARLRAALEAAEKVVSAARLVAGEMARMTPGFGTPAELAFIAAVDAHDGRGKRTVTPEGAAYSELLRRTLELGEDR